MQAGLQDRTGASVAVFSCKLKSLASLIKSDISAAVQKKLHGGSVTVSSCASKRQASVISRDVSAAL